MTDRTAGRGALMDSVDPNDIHAQRAAGWPDFHPEDYCHRCGRRNPLWFSPEWVELTGGDSGILCPPCFAEHDPNALWLVTRYHSPGVDAVALLSATLKTVSDLGDDSARVARCLIDAGWTNRFQEGGVEAERDRYREALEFYAEPDTYFAILFLPDPPCGEFWDDFEEIDGRERPGKLARATLDGAA